jgi:16S rRNA (adenine1518-N6/adenine1519-N6)-dimethyltransferase
MGTLYEEVRAMLRESDFKPRKKLGQNFLIHDNVIQSILRLLDLSARDEVLEIGPGLGFLTRRLVERAAKVWAVEVDTTLVDRLTRSELAAHPAFELIHDDILKINLDDLLPQHKVKLVGNLPYRISTPVLFRLFEWREHFSSLVLMVQKEVADRIASAPGTKSYGTLSVWCQVHGRVAEKVSVSPEAFFPRPKVRSTVLKIDLFEAPRLPAEEIPVLRGLVRAAFGQRRKTLANTMARWVERDRDSVATFLRGEQIDPRRRGETLTIDEFISLTHAVNQQGFLPAGN